MSAAAEERQNGSELTAGHLPERMDVSNRSESFYEQFRDQINPLALIFASLFLLSLGFWFNVVRRQNAEKALKESERRYRAIVDDQTEYICRNRPDFTITFVNQAYARYFQRQPEELVGQSFLPLIPEADHQAIRQYFSALTREQPVASHEHQVLSPEGELRWHQWTNRAIFDDQGVLVEFQGVGRDITDRKLAEQALVESEQRFRSVIEHSPVGVFLFDLRGEENLMLVEANAAAEQILGLPLQDHIGKPVTQVFPGLAGNEVYQIFLDVCRLGQNWQTEQFEYRDDAVDGVFAAFAFQIAPGRMAVLFRDVSERRRSEEAVRQALSEAEEARESVEVILESISDGLLFTDRANRLLLMSPSAETILEQRWFDSFRSPVDGLLAGTPVPAQIAAIGSGSRAKGMVEWTVSGRGGGELRILQAKSSVVKDRSGMIAGVITLLRDVTRERELDRIKSEFISTAAHELRTPLSAVMGFAELLLNPDALDDSTRQEALAIILQKTRVLDQLVDELLDLSRIESGQMLQLNKAPCDLVALLQQCARSFDLVRASHRFEMECAKIAAEVMVDAAKLSQVMDNLLSNAVKFSPAGSLIRVACRVVDDQVRVTVSDEGIGMTPGQMERVFDKFYRVDSSDTAKAGLGLGMAIVKSIIEAHQGRIWVESALGEGTQVHFTLPLLVAGRE